MKEAYSITEATGYFGPGSMTWRLYREPLFVLGGVRALILQVSHPAVADGVARFSNFQADPFGRGYRTFAAMAMIYFGDKQQADATARRLWRIHSGIRGAAPDGSTDSRTPVPYSANDPGLLLWVLATLTDTTLEVYEKMPFANLPADWREQFYEESKTAARVLGIPETAYPPDLAAFRRYFGEMLHGDLLGSTPDCHTMTQAILQHRWSPKQAARLLAAGWLPAPLCIRLGIDAGPEPEANLEKWLRRFVKMYRWLPGFLRYSPAYHQAQYRIARARGQAPAPAGRFFTWLRKKMKVPLGIEMA